MNAPFVPPPTMISMAVARLSALLARGGDSSTSGRALAPAIDDARLLAVADAVGLNDGERLAAALCLAVEADAAVARLVARAQQPVGGSRPLAGLMASLFADEGVSAIGLAGGLAVASGLLELGDENAPLPERAVSMPLTVASALTGGSVCPEGVTALAGPRPPLPPRLVAEGEAFARAAADASTLLLIRTPCQREGEAMAATVAGALGRRPFDMDEADPRRLTAWLAACEALPMVSRQLGPGETVDLRRYDALPLPLIAVCGLDGHVDSGRRTVEWRSGSLTEVERETLWKAGGLEPKSAARAARLYRHGAGRIAELAGRMAGVEGPDDWARLTQAVADGAGRLDMVARRLRANITREAIVLPPELSEALDQLRDRLALRNRLADGLGPTLTARYRPGVRALFTGDSGTGKTLAAHWLAQEAGLPLYRVDLSALTSKYIGETEKNLSQLLDAAEHADVMLFFDEADSLFGARTDVGDSHDRFANAQTNFLLQRIEEFDGVALLATNNRDRFDPAFVRRLDAILEFPLPDAAARRRLWLCHLGEQPEIGDHALNLLAGEVDLAGGHIRNIVLGAAVRAQRDRRAITLADLRAAAVDEYGKLGRAPPPFEPC